MKKLTALAGAAILALTLTACDGDDAEPEATEEGSLWTDEDEERYQAQYEEANAHLLDNYGILESAELCDAEQEALADTENPESLDNFYADFADKVGVDYGDESNPVDNGAVSALIDWCAEA